jgi:hypothetical protein
MVMAQRRERNKKLLRSPKPRNDQRLRRVAAARRDAVPKQRVSNALRKSARDSIGVNQGFARLWLPWKSDRVTPVWK